MRNVLNYASLDVRVLVLEECLGTPAVWTVALGEDGNGVVGLKGL